MERQPERREQSLAWFKLADLISRGEREKALSVFRLLSHSLSDRAYALQLEGDILWYLDDKNCFDKYKQAAFLYQKEKRWIDAIAIYENLLIQHPGSYDILTTLIEFYTMLDWPEKLSDCFNQLVGLFNERQIDELQVEKLVGLLADIVNLSNNAEKKKWFYPWLDQAIEVLPAPLAKRLKGVVAASKPM